MTAPVYVAGSGTVKTGSATPASGTYPTGTVAGDLLVIHLEVRSTNATTPTGGTGWTLTQNWAGGGGPSFFPNTANWVYWRAADGTETAGGSTTTWGITPTSSAWSTAVSRVTGADTTTPLVSGESAMAKESVSTASRTLPQVTTNGPDRLILYCATTSATPTFSVSSPATTDYQSATGSGQTTRAIWGGYETQASAGTTTAETLTGSGIAVMQTIAISSPAAAAVAQQVLVQSFQPLSFY